MLGLQRPVDVDRYLDRIGLDTTPGVDLDGLTTLMAAHLRSVPFENLDVVARIPVPVDADVAIAKIVDRRRGGWCFEANAAFAALLEALGFRVALLGAAVLLDGPTTVIDHLTLEVDVPNGGGQPAAGVSPSPAPRRSPSLSPYLVDVGFGDSFTRPLRLNDQTPQDGGPATFQLFGSPQGTTLTKLVDDVPTAQYRFKRVAHSLADFTAASAALQQDRTLDWSTKAFATRLLDGDDRVTLRPNVLKLRRNGIETETPVASQDWDSHLAEWFAIAAKTRRKPAPKDRLPPS